MVFIAKVVGIRGLRIILPYLTIGQLYDKTLLAVVHAVRGNSGTQRKRGSRYSKIDGS